MLQESFNFVDSRSSKDDDYIVSDSNFSAFSYINKWPDWDSNILLIYGSKSCGKTHLATIWGRIANARFITAEDIYQNNYDLSFNYILDGVEKVSDEPALLHFFNAVKETTTGYLVMTARDNPANIGIRLADLRSRLAAVSSIRINDTDDEMMRQMLVKKFAERQLKVEMDVIKYIVHKAERSFSALDKIVDTLDTEALKNKKNITIPFVKTVLGAV